MITEHSVAIYDWAVVTPFPVANTSGAWTAIAGSEREYQGHADIEDNGSTTFTASFSVYNNAWQAIAVPMRIWDVTNGAAIVTFTAAVPVGGGTYIIGPLPLPTADAVWRCEYSFNDAGLYIYCAIIGARLAYGRLI